MKPFTMAADGERVNKHVKMPNVQQKFTVYNDAS